MKVGIAVGIVIAVIALVVCLVPLKTVAYTVMVDYEDTETYYENVAYNTTETYTEDVPLSYEADSYVRKVKGTETSSITIGGYTETITKEGYLDIACVEVTNTDTIAGTFEVSFDVAEPTFGELTLEHSALLEPGQNKVAECPADELGDWTYTVTPPTKEVEMERTVIKYEQVPKQRTVIKQRQETRYKKVTLLNYLLHHRGADSAR